MRDMFGNEMTIDEARAAMGKKRTDAIPRGYAAPPGSGPQGETCKTCEHIYRNRMSKTYLKCSLNRANWSGGRGSDIKASAPACSRWSPGDKDERP